MTRKINLTPIPWPIGAASAAAIFALIWLLSKPSVQLFDASRISVISVWTGALAVLCLLYIKRYALALWLHGALAACFWTRIFAGADQERSRAFGPYGLGEQLNWIITDDLFPLFCIATLTSLMLIAASIGGARLYRRAGKAVQ
ncbi:MAG TPA: hypothetical protein VIR28_01070 [Achromobacter sp.]|uniref:hypothetical protein n=1 Tax=unclassified Achromobacter TaxID=2626865 RepID=UPI000CFBAEBF|nr:hypothetical protein [Achromobacter sp. MYb9]PQZ61593.1 hypothetical protein CQ050_24445 [Achromobacter sp. MYb9]